MSIFRVSKDKFDATNNISAVRKVDLQRIKAKFIGSSSGVQCERLLTALVRFRITTFEAMRYLDVYHCPARVFQLRKRGYKIITYWETVVTESGEKHVVGCYYLDLDSNHSTYGIDASMHRVSPQLVLPFEPKNCRADSVVS